MNSLIKNTPLKSLVKRSIPPLYKDLLIWTNRVYDPTTHQIKSRISPQYNLTLKQGLCASFNGVSSECSLATPIDLTGNWSIQISFAPAVVNVLQYFISEVLTSPTRRFYVALNDNGKIKLQIGTGTPVDVSNALSVGASYTLYMSYSSATGIITSKLRTLSTGALENLTDYTVEGLDATNGTWRIGRAPSSGWYSGCIHELTIWKSTKTVAQMDSTKTDAELMIPFSGSAQDIKGAITINSANITYGRSDYATFRSDEYGFAVKSGTIYPMKLDGTGYAGLVGEPDAVYHGLIATKGQIEIAGQNYLKTLFDFEQTVNTAIEEAGLILDDYTALDCNDDLIYTADPYLDPLTYPNAFTAMTLANVSQQRYSDLADNNASRRIFIKYRRGTDVTDDGSRALITAGTIAEILVYKRDLSVAEAIRVLKYCADMPMDNQTMVGDVPSVDADDNFVFSCIGHTEPEIEIEEP
jgi:hypothetical protein